MSLYRTRAILALILFLQLALGILYAVRTPHWQAPDEPAHYNYVRVLAETATFPVLLPGDYNGAYLDKIKSEKFPPDLSIDSIRYEAHQPPLYYLAAAPVYLAAGALQLDPVLALRLLNVLLALCLSLLTFRVLEWVFPHNALLPLVGVGILATLPMHLAMSAAINNDTLAEVVVALILLLALARLRGTLPTRRYWLLGGLAYAVALLTKTTIYSSAVLLVVGEVGYQSITQPGGGTATRARALLTAAVTTLVPLFALSLALSGAWFVRNALVYGPTDLFGWARHDAVVAGQMTTAQWIADNGLRNTLVDLFAISFKSFWAQFGWMGVLVNDRLYVFFLILTAAATLGAVFMLVRLVRARRRNPPAENWTWVLLGTLLALVVAADAYYNLKFFQPQGRYLFSGLIALAALWSGGLYELLNARYARVVFGLLYVMMLGVDYLCLAWYIVPQLAR